MFKLKFNFIHIGDQISTTSIPENIFRATGQKCVITDPRIWVFEHNPYVEFKEESECQDLMTIDLVPDCRIQIQANSYSSKKLMPVSCGQADYMCHQLGIEQPQLRHSRLYIYEDLPRDPAKIVVHTQGSDRTRDNEPAIRYSSGEDDLRIMTTQVLDAIRKNYKDYKLVQVGSTSDIALGGNSIDLRGQTDYWGTIKEIATASRFIGVNSGPMHMANCYPHIDKRVVFMEFPETTLSKFRPGDVRNWLFSWVDPTNMFFNKFDYDVGLTYSYKKI